MPGMRLKLKHLQSKLEDIEAFKNPKVELEQYATPPEIAALTTYSIQMDYRDIEGRMVADLGCGCGMLSIAASLLGCSYCVGFDIDAEALEHCKLNIEQSADDVDNIDVVQLDVTSPHSLDVRWHKKFDTVIMNPPFGTKDNEGIDMKFLEFGLALAKRAVYSMHKATAVENLRRKLSKLDPSVELVVMSDIQFNVSRTYSFHKHDSKDIKVVLIRLSRPKSKPIPKTIPKRTVKSATTKTKK